MSKGGQGEESKIGQHPISSFNLNAHGENPDIEIAGDTGPLLETSPELAAELRDTQFLADPDTDQRFEVLWLNRGLADKPLLVTTLAYSIDPQHGNTNYSAEQLAVQYGGPMLVLGNPSVGESDKMSRDQRHELEKGEGFNAVARPMLRAMKAAGVERADFQGTSMGAVLAAGLYAHAAEAGIQVDRLVLLDPPGLEDRALRDMAKAFLVTEGSQNAPEYRKHSTDPRAKEAADSPLDALRNFARMIRKDARGNVISYPKAMSRATILPNLVAGLESQPHSRVAVISGGASEIARSGAVNHLFGQLAEHEYRDRVRMIRLPGDTHSMTEGHPRRIAWYINEALR